MRPKVIDGGPKYLSALRGAIATIRSAFGKGSRTSETAAPMASSPVTAVHITSEVVGPQVVENIYDPVFIATEQADNRPTVVFDLDNTLIVVKDGKATLRPGAREVLESLRNEGIKTVLWTNGKTDYAVRHLQNTGLYELFDIVIAEEAYCAKEFLPWESETARQSFDEVLGTGATDRAEEFNLDFSAAKNLGILGYEVIVDDNPRVFWEAQEGREFGWEFASIQCSYFDGGNNGVTDFSVITQKIRAALLENCHQYEVK